MQLLSPMTILAAAAAPDFPWRFQEFFQRPEIQHLATVFGAVIVAGMLLSPLAYWISSRILAHRDTATFPNALKLWVSYLLLAALWTGGVVYLGMWLFKQHTMPDARIFLMAGGAALFYLLMIFYIPMKIYTIGFLRALGFILLAGVMRNAVTSAASQVVFRLPSVQADLQSLNKEFSGMNQADAQRFVERLVGKEAPDEIDRMLDDALHPIGPKPPLKERQAEVAELQKKLQARQASFPPGAPAPAEFSNQKVRYIELLNQVKAEMSNPPPPPAAPAH